MEKSTRHSREYQKPTPSKESQDIVNQSLSSVKRRSPPLLTRVSPGGRAAVATSPLAHFNGGIRFTIPVSNKWSWTFGILTAAAFAFAVIFFAVSQQPTGRDWAVLMIGALVGATAAALVATFVFHSDLRSRKLETAESVAQASAKADQERYARQAAAELALTERRTSLLASLSTRNERLSEIEDEIMKLRIEVTTADGNYKVGMTQAKDAANRGFNDIAQENLANAKSWEIAKARFAQKLRTLEQERDRLSAISDEEYLAEQKHLRGLD